MNSCWIILLLLFCGQNGNGIFGRNGFGGRGRNRNGCGCDDNDGRNGCGCDDNDDRNGRGRDRNDGRNARGCDERPCEDSRFEPRFEQRPFSGDGSTCGCEAEGN